MPAHRSRRNARRISRLPSSLPLLMGLALLAACGDSGNTSESREQNPDTGTTNTGLPAGSDGTGTPGADEALTDLGSGRGTRPVVPVAAPPGGTVTPVPPTGAGGGNQPGTGNVPGTTPGPANGGLPVGEAGTTGGNTGNGPQTGTTTPNATVNRPRVGDLMNDPTCPAKFHYREADLNAVGADPDFPLQWNLNNTGSALWGAVAGEDINVLGTWGAGKGEGIRIAIVDTSANVLHPDLLPNIVPGESYNYGPFNRGSAWPLPCASETHGTSVGGVAGARDNNGIGIAGVAPRASLVFYNPLREAIEREAGPFNESADEADALVRGLDRNHVYNLSWARGPLRFGHMASADDMRAGIRQGIEQGRQGLGAIYVVSANNYGNCQYTSNGVCRPYLSNWNGVASEPGSVTVCATTAQGTRAPYSNQGANLLVCAPSSSPATDDFPSRGVPSTAANGYTPAFGGTSASAPMVSGVTALMLQANPLLTWRDVRQILARTARKVDPKSATWTTFGTLNYSHDYGFGVVDADAAVKASRTWQSVGASSTLKQCGPFVQAGQATIPGRIEGDEDRARMMDAGRTTTGYLQSGIRIPAACDIRHIEHVEVTLKGQNIQTVAGYTPDAMIGQENLHILLTSPSQQTSILSTPHECMGETSVQGTIRQQKAYCTGLNGYAFGLTRHMDEPALTAASSTWTLSMMYWLPPDHGSEAISNLALNRWELTLYGR